MKYTTYECDLCHKKYNRHQDRDTIDISLLGLTIVDHPKAKRIFQTTFINDASIHICVGCISDIQHLSNIHSTSINAERIKNGIAPMEGE